MTDHSLMEQLIELIKDSGLKLKFGGTTEDCVRIARGLIKDARAERDVAVSSMEALRVCLEGARSDCNEVVQVLQQLDFLMAGRGIRCLICGAAEHTDTCKVKVTLLKHGGQP